MAQDFMKNLSYKHTDYLKSLEMLREAEQKKLDSEASKKKLEIEIFALKEQINMQITQLRHLEKIKEIESQNLELQAQIAEAKRQGLLSSISVVHGSAYIEELVKGLKTIKLNPDRNAHDYLNNTSRKMTASEAIRKDWENIGFDLYYTLHCNKP